ncbi:hypothetical protein KDD30_21705 (plasmid) [Photobacterium sp. GJ3]|uniref:hypothetical protein n=1 Tax=Photobacterium sp. GJ3 TaxID=2829502 RepID=UPI001B8BFFDF|nr:hypothetical protein [Photobacterium sp. GJ3]QUJ69384.1 hypothetical protein KDD30_21705 [Photobacterium sp. GJ3]
MCHTANGKLISICGRDQVLMDQYGRPGHVELALTPTMHFSRQSFAGWNEGMLLSFQNHSYQYHVFGFYSQALERKGNQSQVTATHFQSGIYVEKNGRPLTTIRCSQSSIGIVPDDRETETLLSQYLNLVPAEFDFEVWINKDQDADDYGE